MGFYDAPPTLRSAGVEPKPAPARRLAWATYEVVRAGCAIVDVTYLGAPDLYSIFRVEIRCSGRDANGIDPLYEESYRQACLAARTHGYEIDRFAAA